MGTLYSISNSIRDSHTTVNDTEYEKLFNEKELYVVDNDYQHNFITGLNKFKYDNVACTSNFKFCDDPYKLNLSEYRFGFHSKYYVRRITIPPEALVVKFISHGNTYYYTDNVVLSEKINVSTIKLWEDKDFCEKMIKQNRDCIACVKNTEILQKYVDDLIYIKYIREDPYKNNKNILKTLTELGIKHTQSCCYIAIMHNGYEYNDAILDDYSELDKNICRTIINSYISKSCRIWLLLNLKTKTSFIYNLAFSSILEQINLSTESTEKITIRSRYTTSTDITAKNKFMIRTWKKINPNDKTKELIELYLLLIVDDISQINPDVNINQHIFSNLNMLLKMMELNNVTEQISELEKKILYKDVDKIYTILTYMCKASCLIEIPKTILSTLLFASDDSMILKHMYILCKTCHELENERFNRLVTRDNIVDFVKQGLTRIVKLYNGPYDTTLLTKLYSANKYTLHMIPSHHLNKKLLFDIIKIDCSYIDSSSCDLNMIDNQILDYIISKKYNSNVPEINKMIIKRKLNNN